MINFPPLYVKPDGLRHSVVVIVPNTWNVDTPMSDATHERLVAITTKLLSRMFGGATAIRASYGGWYSEDLGRLIVEQPSLVFAFSDTLTPLEIERITRFARLMRRVARQEAIAVILGGRMQFI